MNVDIKVRDEMKSRFGKILPTNSIEQIEKSIHNFSIDYASVNETPYLLDQIYDTKGDEILKLIKDPENDYFITAIKNKKIDLEQIAFLKPDELNPEKYNKIIKKKALEEYKKNNQATSNVFECKKCKNKKCQVTQRQTRAADEPATTFVTCMECGYEFSFN
jgi:transcription elongation factor S-II